MAIKASSLSDALAKGPTGDLPPITLWGVVGDGLLWLGLLALIYGCVHQANLLKPPEKRSRAVVLTLDDANALTKGSAVRLMGVEVGSVQSVMLDESIPGNKKIKLLLALRPGTPVIPPNAHASVVFYGFGGNKSLEFSLPEGDTTSEASLSAPASSGVYAADPTIRMKQAMALQVETANALKAGADSLNAFFERYPVPGLIKTLHQLPQKTQRLIEQSPYDVQQVRGFSTQSAQMLRTTSQGLAHLAQEVEGISQKTSTVLQGWQNPTGPKLPYDGLQQLQAILQGVNQPLDACLQQTQKTPLTTHLQQNLSAINQWPHRLSQNQARLENAMPPLENRLNEIDTVLLRLQQSALPPSQTPPTGDPPRLEKLRQARIKIQALNEALVQLNASLEEVSAPTSPALPALPAKAPPLTSP